jgi:tetratricopeptide (TPR) repeat protein
MVADCYLHLTPPRLQRAMQQNELLLALPNLSPRQRDQALLLKGEILLEQHQLAESRQAFAEIDSKSPLHPEATLELVRLSLLEAKRTQEMGDAAAVPDYPQLLKQLAAIAERTDIVPGCMARAQLLMGLCYVGQKQDDEAIEQFARVRRDFLGQPEAIAASLYEAELLQEQGGDDEAAKLYLRLLEQAGTPENYDNSWLPLAELDNRLLVAFDKFLTDNHYAQATELAQASGPLLSEVRSREMRARGEEAWGRYMERQAADSPDEAGTLLAEARDHYREAGTEFERLAELRIATRFYLDDLARSGQSYLLGHGFRQAAAIFRKLIAQESTPRTPEALAGLGQSLLATGDLDGALSALQQCCEGYPNHPATYSSRLLAALVMVE